MKDNNCKGCIHDSTDKEVSNIKILSNILDYCSCCKRGVKEEYQENLLDLYESN